MEEAEDESEQLEQCPAKNFQVSVFNVILDTASAIAKRRFEENDDLFRDIAYLDPQSFKSFQKIPAERLHAVSNLADVNREVLCDEL